MKNLYSESRLVAFFAVLTKLIPAGKCVPQETYRDNNPFCDCYATNSGGIPTFFHNFRFYDFRHYATSPTDYKTDPPLVTVPGGSENITSQVFNDPPFVNDWNIMSWSSPASGPGLLPRTNSFQNVYLKQTNATDLGTNDPTATTFLTLRASRNPTFYSIAEIDNSHRNFHFGSVRFYARVRGSTGTCAGMFLYQSEVHETDIEILTNNGSTIYYSNQPSVDDNGEAITLATDAYTTSSLNWNLWHEHRIDWDNGVTKWYLDGVWVANSTYQVPDVPMGMILNMWSDGGNWTGDMPVNGVSYLDIQWIQATFNTTGAISGLNDLRFPRPSTGKRQVKANTTVAAPSCKKVCKIDGVKTTGTPEFGMPTIGVNEAPAGSFMSGNSTSSSSASGGGPGGNTGVTVGSIHTIAAVLNSLYRLFRQ